MITDPQPTAGVEALVAEANDFAERMVSQPWACELIERLRDRLLAALSEAARQTALLSDPQAVHLNMLRGSIAKPSVEAIRHIYGDELSAPSPPGEEGWVMVPKEPDHTMIAEGEEAARRHLENREGDPDFSPGVWWPSPARIYRAMLAAAPPAPDTETRT